MKRMITALVASLTLAVGAQASTLAGDTVDFALDTTADGTIYTATAEVDDGIDGKDGPFSVDLNAGKNGNGFVFSVTPNSAFRGFVAEDGSLTTLVFSDLDFSDGSFLKDFVVTGAASIFASVQILSPTSIAFTFFDQAFVAPADGVLLSGNFITSIPVPAGGVLLLTGLGLLVLARRRRSA